MKTAIILIAVFGTAIAAPTEDKDEVLRTKKHLDALGLKLSPFAQSYGSYGGQSYGGHSSGGGSYGGGSYGGGSYGGSYSPVALYLGPQPGKYREDEGHHEEGKGRSYGAESLGGLSGASSGAYGAGAVGVFPNAQVGGCNVPLLLSCSPNIVSGHLAAQGYGAPAYRSEEVHEIESNRAVSHHKVSKDYPEPHPGNHHLISKDYPQPNVTKVVPHNESEMKKKL